MEAFLDSVTLADCVDIPVELKFVLDFLDDEASRNGVTDPSVIRAWKTNAVVLRFWMQLLHNPDTTFDVQRQHSLLPSLAVVGQTLVDTFSQSNLVLGKESPSSKLLFAREIANYHPLVGEMFARIAGQRPLIEHQRFLCYLGSSTAAASAAVSGSASWSTAVFELLNWVKAYGLSLLDLMEQDPIAAQHRLGEHLRQIVHCSLVESEHVYGKRLTEKVGFLAGSSLCFIPSPLFRASTKRTSYSASSCC